jgi:hypothetical protein
MNFRGLHCCLLLGALAAGCSSYRELPRSQWSESPRYDDVRVATVDGFEYRFDSAVVTPDTLLGFFSVSQERADAGRVWYEDVQRRHPIPRNRIVRVELVRKDPMKTALYGAGFAAAGFLLVTFVNEEIRGPSTGGTGGGKGTGKP